MSRDKALISTLYESGCRIGELGRLTWRNLVFDKYGIKMYIDDQKAEKVRFCRLTFSTSYIALWKNEYPQGSPEGDAPVFLTYQNKPLEYQTVQAMLKRVAERAVAAGWKTKKIHPHLFRKSRITDMIDENYQESVIKEMMWGNPVTSMFKTYVKLSEQMIDNEMLDKAGIVKKEEVVRNPLVSHVCMRCHKTNGPDARFCNYCGLEFTEEAAADMETFKGFVEEHFEEIFQLFSGYKKK
jgi:Site-specific recombinase XerD